MKAQILLPKFTGFYECDPIDLFLDDESEEITNEFFEGKDCENDEFFTKCDEIRTELDEEIDYAKSYANICTDLCENVYSDALGRRVEFITVDSPKYYNLSTDKIIAEVDWDLDEIKSVVNEPEFATWLKDNYSSRDGFWSFVPTIVSEFLAELINEREGGYNRNLSIVFEYLMQNHANISGFDTFASVYELIEYK